MKKLFICLITMFLLLQGFVGVLAYEMSTVQVETTAGNKEIVEVAVTTETENGITKTTSEANQYVTDSGIVVDYSGNSTSYLHNDGKTTGNGSDEYTAADYANGYYAYGGSEYTIERVSSDLDVDVVIDDEGDSTSEDKGSSGVTDTTGDEKTSNDDGTYDYTVVTFTDQANLKVTTHSAVIKEEIHENHQPLEHIYSAVTPSNGGQEIMDPVTPVVVPSTPTDVPTIAKGYEYVNLGIKTLSHYWATVNYKSKSSDLPDEPAIYTDKDGNSYFVHHLPHSTFYSRDLVLSGIYVNGEYIPAPLPEEGETAKSKYFPARYDAIQQFLISDKYGNVATTYCVDQTTVAEHGYSYKIKNIEDADYYDQENADMIRSVAWNGYWGTESGLGSLEEVKKNLRETGDFTEEELAKLTDGVAMTATQYAIWTFSNHMDDVVFLNAYYRTRAGGTPGKGNIFTAPKESSDVLMKFYDYLINLEPISVTDKSSENTIINEDNFIDSVNVEVLERPLTEVANLDDDDSNDAYKANVSFKLAVRPRSATDALYVTLVNGNDEVLAGGRIAGTLQDGETYLEMSEGSYVFNNVPLTEGTAELKFYINGHQYVEKGVYIYDSEEINGTKSQTMIGIANGNRDVNVCLALDFTLEVKDGFKKTERFYRNEKTIEPVLDNISGIKYLDNHVSEGFVFTLSDENGVLEEVVSGEDGVFSFAPITFSKAGTYTFTVTEKVENDPQVIYDETVYIVTYTVEGVDDYLFISNKTVQSMKDNSVQSAGAITFNNKTLPPPPTGDTNNVILYMAFAGASVLALFFLVKLRKSSSK